MLTIKAPSTFTAKVEIPTPGSKPTPITLTFKHKTRDQLTHFLTSEDAKSRSDVDTVAEIVSGWENVDAEFTPDNIEAMLDQYHGAARAILNAYIEQLTQVRLGN